MAKYEVWITRVGELRDAFVVEASSEREAEDLAWNLIPDSPDAFKCNDSFTDVFPVNEKDVA